MTQWSRGRSTPARLVLRAGIVLAAADGRRNKEISVELRCTPRTVGVWRRRFAETRLAGIKKDAPGGGRRATTRASFEAEIIRKTTQEMPPDATQWCATQWCATQWCATQWCATQWCATQWCATQWCATQWCA
nr:helix-turn-helix domain-containing protein [Planctomycetaceae bacterium]